MKALALRSLNLSLAFQICWALAVWLSELRSKDEELLYLVQRACPDAGTKPGPGRALGPKRRLSTASSAEECFEWQDRKTRK
jgi:hypothetical protein